jgi:hypothetical protein
VAGVAAGAALAIAPDGSLLHVSRAVLARTPFSSFLVPGLVLLVAVGLTNVLAGVHMARDLFTARHRDRRGQAGRTIALF